MPIRRQPAAKAANGATIGRTENFWAAQVQLTQ